MPNPKVGTVTPDVANAVRNAKAGQARYRVDKAGVVHCAIGRAGFEVGALKENLLALMRTCRRPSRPPRRASTSSASRCPRPWGRVSRWISRRWVFESFLIWCGSVRDTDHHRRPQASP